MSTATKQNLSLGKLRRAVDGNNSYTAAASMSQMSGSSATSPAPVKMSDFSISSVESVTGFTYLWEQTSEDYQINFGNSGSLFNQRVASRTQNVSWSFDGNLDITIGSADYIASVTAGTINNPSGDIAGTFNQSGSLMVKFAEDGQSDGFNDHATRYNTNVSKSIEVVDTYGGVPTCLMFGSQISKSDGSVVDVEDLNIGDEILSISLPNATDESSGTWESDEFNRTGSFAQHSSSVSRVRYEFSKHYYDINSGSEKITGEHEMLYKPVGENFWMWQLVPGMKVGGHLMGKDGSSIEITSLEQMHSDDGFEVVQIDVEPLDFYFGNTFLVHNKGSNDDPFD